MHRTIALILLATIPVLYPRSPPAVAASPAINWNSVMSNLVQGAVLGGAGALTGTYYAKIQAKSKNNTDWIKGRTMELEAFTKVLKAEEEVARQERKERRRKQKAGNATAAKVVVVSLESVVGGDAAVNATAKAIAAEGSVVPLKDVVDGAATSTATKETAAEVVVVPLKDVVGASATAKEIAAAAPAPKKRKNAHAKAE